MFNDSPASSSTQTHPLLALATNNSHKVGELRAILDPLLPQMPHDYVASIADLNLDEPVENGVSFTQNALIKARAIAQASGLPTIADDSGLSVDVLGGSPGIFSARWCGYHGDDRANLDLLLAQMSDVPDRYRSAAFMCAAALVLPDGREWVETGEIQGVLLRERSGEGGFGYDPIFVPQGYSITTAQMSPDEKNAISHRAIAFSALAPHIVDALSAQ